MIEAVPVLFVAAVAVASYVAARVHVANPENQNSATEIDRLRAQRSWLQARLQLAWRENWDPSMVARLADELESTEAQLIALESKPEVT